MSVVVLSFVSQPSPGRTLVERRASGTDAHIYIIRTLTPAPALSSLSHASSIPGVRTITKSGRFQVRSS